MSVVEGNAFNACASWQFRLGGVSTPRVRASAVQVLLAARRLATFTGVPASNGYILEGGTCPDFPA